MSYFDSRPLFRRTRSAGDATSALAAKPVLGRKKGPRMALGNITNRNKEGGAGSSKNLKKKQFGASTKPVFGARQRMRSYNAVPGHAKPGTTEAGAAPRRMLLAGHTSAAAQSRGSKPGMVSVFGNKHSSSIDLMSGTERLARKHTAVPAPGAEPSLSLPSMDMDLDVHDDSSKTTLDDDLFQMELDAPSTETKVVSATGIGGKYDVDSCDLGDSQAVAEYADDIMKYLRSVEAQHLPVVDYMSQQTSITPKMREILVSWLVEVHAKFRMRLEVLYLAVNILDRFLSKITIRRAKLQLVGCASLLLASKYEEIYAPEVNDFVYICDRAYSREEILQCEGHMLNHLSFNLSIPYSFRFAERLMKVAGADDMTCLLAAYINELSLQKYELLQYKPSMIGSAASFLALSLRRGRVQWTEELAAHSNYTQQDIMQCARDLYAIFSVEKPKYKAVRVKYSSSKRQRVALGPFPTLQL